MSELTGYVWTVLGMRPAEEFGEEGEARYVDESALISLRAQVEALTRSKDTFFDQSCENLKRAQAAEARAEALQKDAERWRAFTGSYVRLIGWAGYGSDKDPYGNPWGNYRHFGAEFWTQGNAADRKGNPETIAVLNDFADAAIDAALSEKRET